MLGTIAAASVGEISDHNKQTQRELDRMKVERYVISRLKSE